MIWILFLISCLRGSPPIHQECPFCDKSVIEYQKFYEDDLVIALINYKPVLPGHSLIIPKRHVEKFDLLTDEEALRVHQVIKKVHHASKTVFNAHSYVIYQKNGQEVGQTVPHLHFHYVPRPPGEDSILSLIFHLSPANLKKTLSSPQMADSTKKMNLQIEESVI